MPERWIMLIPEDPRCIPDEARRQHACARFAEIAPEADAIEITLSENVCFFDCGSHFVRIACPACAVEIPEKWWHERMDEDCAGGGFQLSSYATPCCSTPHTLNALHYEGTQGFAQFAVEVMNPNRPPLDAETLREFEEILGTRLRVIYQQF